MPYISKLSKEIWLWLDDAAVERLQILVFQFKEREKQQRWAPGWKPFASRVINLEKLLGWEPGLPPSVRRAGQHTTHQSPSTFCTHAIQHFHPIHILSARPNQIITSGFFTGWKVTAGHLVGGSIGSNVPARRASEDLICEWGLKKGAQSDWWWRSIITEDYIRAGQIISVKIYKRFQKARYKNHKEQKTFRWDPRESITAEQSCAQLVSWLEGCYILH